MRYLTALLLVCTLLVGSVPQNLSYQGFIKASDGSLLPDDTYTVTFRIYEEATGGVALWSEEHEIYLKSGMISATLGESTSFTFSTKMNYLEIVVNSDIMVPRQKMTSVTYAFPCRVGPEDSYRQYHLYLSNGRWDKWSVTHHRRERIPFLV